MKNMKVKNLTKATISFMMPAGFVVSFAPGDFSSLGQDSYTSLKTNPLFNKFIKSGNLVLQEDSVLRDSPVLMKDQIEEVQQENKPKKRGPKPKVKSN